MCRLGVTKKHLGCRAHRINHYNPFASPFGSRSEFDIGWLFGTCLHLQCVHRDGDWSLCVANRDYYGRLLWVPNELVCTSSAPPRLEEDDRWFYTGRRVYLHGLPDPWYVTEGESPSSVVRVFRCSGEGEALGEGLIASVTIFESLVRWKNPCNKKPSEISSDIRRRRRLPQCFY